MTEYNPIKNLNEIYKETKLLKLLDKYVFTYKNDVKKMIRDSIYQEYFNEVQAKNEDPFSIEQDEFHIIIDNISVDYERDLYKNYDYRWIIYLYWKPDYKYANMKKLSSNCEYLEIPLEDFLAKSIREVFNNYIFKKYKISLKEDKKIEELKEKTSDFLKKYENKIDSNISILEKINQSITELFKEIFYIEISKNNSLILKKNQEDVYGIIKIHNIQCFYNTYKEEWVVRIFYSQLITFNTYGPVKFFDIDIASLVTKNFKDLIDPEFSIFYSTDHLLN